MIELFIGFIVFLVAVMLMSVGILLGKRGITGGCGHACRIPGYRPLCGGACHSSPGKGTAPPARAP